MRHRRDLERWLGQYQIGIDNIRDVDLRQCYIQQRPNFPIDKLLVNGDGIVDSRMTNSPHHELADLYVRRGEGKARKRFKGTRYCQMSKMMGRGNFPIKLPGLHASLKKGYLRKKHKWNFIVVLMEPFASSRYKRNVVHLVPEVWAGHHRAAMLLALGKTIVRVVVGKDLKPGSRKCAGKIHDLCVKK